MRSKACWAIAIISALAWTFIYYCEKLQLLPLTRIGLLSRMIIAALICGLITLLMCILLQKAIRKTEKFQLVPILLSGLVLSACFMVWFPIPNTGLYYNHALEITAIPNESGTVNPVSLTWFHTDHGDIPLHSVKCEGNCTVEEFGPRVSDVYSVLRWKGKTGDRVTLEFAAGSDQGVAEISWDGNSRTVSLNNEEFNRLSYDFIFPVNSGLTEFFAVWVICFLLSVAALVTFIVILPNRSIRSVGIFAFICFVVFRIFQFRTIREPLFFIDSESYLGMSEMTFSEILRGTDYCHRQFWYCIARPPFIPLIYKLCRQAPQTITFVQLCISVLCWGFFAQRTAGLCQSDKGKKAAVILSLGLGCVPNVTRWDGMIMSESLSISASLLLMGGVFWLTKPSKEKRWCWIAALCTAFGALCYAQSRDSAVWSVILIAVLLLCINKLRRNRKAIFCLCIVLAGISYFTVKNGSGRWQYPFENVLFNRIVRDPQAEAFFISEGMPTPSRINELYGVEHMMGSELFNSEEMASLRQWILSDGLKTYIKYMLRSPMKTLRMAWRAGFEKEAFEQIDYTFTPNGFHKLLPDPLCKFLSCNFPAVLIIGLGLAGIFAAFTADDGEKYSFPVLFVLSAYILCSGVIIADEYEFARHSIVIILMMKASAWSLIILLCEEFKKRAGATKDTLLK